MVLLLSAAGLGLVAHATQAPASSPEAAFAKGKHAYEAGDYVTAKPLLEDASKGGKADAMALMGDMYHGGENVPQDDKLAMRWYEAAAQRGSAYAMMRIGTLFSWGHGVVRDSAMAHRWFQEAAARGNALAMYNLGVDYEQGFGVKGDLCLALAWYRKSAAAQEPNGFRAVGAMYESGSCVEKNLNMARQNYKKAISLGDEAAKDRLADLDRPPPPPVTQDRNACDEYCRHNKDLAEGARFMNWAKQNGSW